MKGNVVQRKEETEPFGPAGGAAAQSWLVTADKTHEEEEEVQTCYPAGGLHAPVVMVIVIGVLMTL